MVAIIFTCTSNHAQWSSYTFPEAGIKCDFPQKPKHEITEKKSSTSHKMTVLHEGTSYLFIVTVSDVDLEAAGKTAEDVYSNFSEQYTEESKSKFTTKYTGKTGINAKLKTDDTFIKYRALIIKNRIFQLIAVSSSNYTSAENTKKFFDSFERIDKKGKVITKLDEDGTWSMRTYGDIHVKAKFPKKPTYTKTEKEKFTSHKIFLTTDDGITYAILGTKSKSEVSAEEYKAVFKKYTSKGEVTDKKIWEMKNHTGYKAKFVNENNQHMHYAIVVIDDTILQAMVIGKTDFPDSAKALKFFEHLEIID